MKRNALVALALCAAAAAARADEPRAAATTLPAQAQMPPNVTLVEARMQRRALHAFNATTGIRLPRIQVYRADHGHLLHVIGWDANVVERVHRVIAKPDMLPGNFRLDAIVDDIEDSATGRPLAVADLPPADFYLTTSWAGWCRPCGTAMVELRKVLEADAAHRYVWLMIETDVPKQRLMKQTIR